LLQTHVIDGRAAAAPSSNVLLKSNQLNLLFKANSEQTFFLHKYDYFHLNILKNKLLHSINNVPIHSVSIN